MNDNTLQKIETLLAHQEQQITDLSDMVIAQGKEIDTLKRRLEQTQSKLAKIEASAGEGHEALGVAEQAALDKPPHY